MAEHSRNHRYCAPCHAAYMRNWRKTHREPYDCRHRARVRMNMRQRRGRLVHPLTCPRCGGAKPEKHHPDYSQPTLILWLCRACHLAEHGKVVAK
jgi:hypothetical protein